MPVDTFNILLGGIPSTDLDEERNTSRNIWNYFLISKFLPKDCFVCTTASRAVDLSSRLLKKMFTLKGAVQSTHSLGEVILPLGITAKQSR